MVNVCQDHTAVGVVLRLEFSHNWLISDKKGLNELILISYNLYGDNSLIFVGK
jgi:hypothetical protein